MTTEEKETLQIAIQTICDPRGNWLYGWGLICELGGIDPIRNPPPFRKRTEEELKHLGDPGATLRLPPEGSS